MLVTYSSLLELLRQVDLDDVEAFVAGRLQGGLRWFPVLELATEWVGILGLVEITECVVDTTMDGFIGSNVQDEILHGTFVFRNVPVLAQC